VANIKSQKKRILQDERRRVHNRAIRTALKTSTKKVREAVDGQDAEAAEARRREANRDLDKAASKGAIHKRTAARRKSRLARSVAGSSATAE